MSQKKIAVTLVVSSLLFALGAFWWWAVEGMKPEAGVASCATWFVLFFGGIAVGEAA